MAPRVTDISPSPHGHRGLDGSSLSLSLGSQADGGSERPCRCWTGGSASRVGGGEGSPSVFPETQPLKPPPTHPLAGTTCPERRPEHTGLALPLGVRPACSLSTNKKTKIKIQSRPGSAVLSIPASLGRQHLRSSEKLLQGDRRGSQAIHNFGEQAV